MNKNGHNNQNDLISQNNRSNQSNQNSQSSQNNPTPPTPPTILTPPNNPTPPKSSPITFLPQHGHYRNLRVYQVAEIIYDITYYFTQHYLAKGDRTVDQMVQAARSGKQNISEGNRAAATSSETEIKLTNVAKASLEELLNDYEDYLRVRNLPRWDAQHPRYEKMRQYARSEQIKKDYTSIILRMTDEEMANLCITLIHQATYMLRKLLETMQNRFVTEGGIKERMYQSRVAYRNSLNSQRGQNNRSCQNSQNYPPSPTNPPSSE